MTDFLFSWDDISHGLTNRLGSEMKLAGLAEFILYLDPLHRLDWEDVERSRRTLQQYLRYLELPECASPEKGYDTIRAVWEEWQRPFLLFIDLCPSLFRSEKDIAIAQYVCSNLPRWKKRFVVFNDPYVRIKWQSLSGVTYHPFGSLIAQSSAVE